jgi:valyl-tRNA synthetase
MAELPKHFEHKIREPEIYQRWESSGYFDPDRLPTSSTVPRTSTFCIIMPPPNANGSLHIGHALFVTTQDIMIRYKRMRGFKTLWLPGADHAGFETQVVYAKKIEKEGRKFFEIPREDLYKEILAFTLANKAHMEGQLRALGASCDWSREKFTLDDDIRGVVYETFKMLYDDGLIYRGSRIINWCPKHQTSLSDLEIAQPETTDPFYYLKYGPFTIATARPETKFGDKYVVVHPDDPRYAQYTSGQEFDIEWINGPIRATLIKDAAMDMELGTGAMTITPWHSAPDFELAQRHNLSGEQIIDWHGKLLPIAGEFAGVHISKARAAIVEKLDKKGLLVKVEQRTHAVPVCYKCNTAIEPQVRPQWFVAMTKPSARLGKSLRDVAVEAVNKGTTTFISPRFKTEFTHWMENLRDWNISRQIVWGIRIPVWYKDDHIHVGETAPGTGIGWIQETDVFDTWFSSGQWPFATLLASASPKGRELEVSASKGSVTKDFYNFYPTDVMETGWDILFFWVARMMMLGIYRTGRVPFKSVYLHGLVRDKDRQKMSKSKGNVIDPLGVAGEYGTDAVRMALISGSAAGTDPVISEDKIRGYRNFTTKVWNMAKFILMYADAVDPNASATDRDQVVLHELEKVKASITKNLDEYKLHLAAEETYHYVWHTVADKLIEEYKVRLNGSDIADKAMAATTLTKVFEECLKLLHPFMPYVTEEIWKQLPKWPGKSSMLMVETW